VAGVDIGDVQDRRELAALMVGRAVELETVPSPVQLRGKRLEVRELCADNQRGLPAVKDVSFEICGGEILGICGVDGNGQSELVGCLTGLVPIRSGKVLISGKDIRGLHPGEILGLGVSHIPEDRHKYGMVGPMTLQENLILVSYKQPGYSSRGILLRHNIAKRCAEIIRNFNVKTPSLQELAKNLSGGNQQKLVVGRELERNPDLLIAVHPSRGLDIGATKYIQQQILRQRDRGAAVMMVSTELDELLELSDRILVIYDGEVMDILSRQEATRESLGLLMAGVRQREAEEVLTT
jgi:simple sugar transport system ATP-binding protein